ncbi:MAG: type II toxin-antitoxin system RelE/ParE family toxin [Crocinitomicaceae bacterium]|jgi:toxin ParE1/3/4
MIYVLTKEAESDLEKIWLYSYENWSIEQADRYLNMILNEFDYLCLQPHSGIDFGMIRKDYWRVKVNSHFIFYKIKRNKIEIIRILHEMMDIESHM